MIIISPWAKKLRNGGENPKNYPHWKELVSQINEPIIQIGITGEEKLVTDFRQNLKLDEIKELIQQCRTWVSVDSFFQHFCWSLGKPGIVLWGPSDPNIFGHPENINLLKDRSYLVSNQFLMWEQHPRNEDSFVKPEEVLKFI